MRDKVGQQQEAALHIGQIWLDYNLLLKSKSLIGEMMIPLLLGQMGK